MFPLIKVIIYGLPASTNICMLSVQSSAENIVSGIDIIRDCKSNNPFDPQKILWDIYSEYQIDTKIKYT